MRYVSKRRPFHDSNEVPRGRTRVAAARRDWPAPGETRLNTKESNKMLPENQEDAQKLVIRLPSFPNCSTDG